MKPFKTHYYLLLLFFFSRLKFFIDSTLGFYSNASDNLSLNTNFCFIRTIKKKKKNTNAYIKIMRK